MFPARLHRAIYIVLVTLLGGCMVCSTWAANLVWVLLAANWLLEGRWREKWQMARHSRMLAAYATLCLVLLVGMLWTSNSATGWSQLRTKLPLLVVPLVMLTSRPLEGRVRSAVLWLYAATVLVVSLIATVRMLAIPDMPYRDAVPYISHIRFALNCCMVIFIAVGTYRWPHRSSLWPLTVLRWLAVLWMVVFVLLIRSYTALAVIVAVSLALLLVYYRRWPLMALWCAVMGVATLSVVHEVRSYYRPVPLAVEPLRETTVAGRPYEHACDGIVENGNYINNYVCRPELRTAWTLRSTLPYDSLTSGGFPVEPTLIRYLNACGLAKDSVGVCSLSAADIAAVERGVANPVYESGSPLRKMVYVMALEHEYYRHTHAIRGFSMLQRIELWRATWRVVTEHPAFGVGTGDIYDAVQDQLAAMDSELYGSYKNTHNQYLSLMAMVGLLGFIAVAAMFLRAVLPRMAKPRTSLPPLMMAWMLTVLISFLTEDTLNTLAGILLCTWFLAARSEKFDNATQ